MPEPPLAALSGETAYLDVLVLRALAHHDRPPLRLRLCDEVGLDLGTVNGIVGRLRSAGMLEPIGLTITDAARDAYTTSLWRCRVCGCVDERACEGGCGWADVELCTRCAREAFAQAGPHRCDEHGWLGLTVPCVFCRTLASIDAEAHNTQEVS